MADAAVSTAVEEEFVRRGRWRAFRNPSVEADFRQWRIEQTLPVARAIGAGSAVIWASIPLLYGWIVDTSPLILNVAAWGIAAPILAAVTVISYTPARKWMDPAVALTAIVIGLDGIWVMSITYGRFDGTVALAAVLIALFAFVARVSTEAAVVVTLILFGVPVAIHVDGVLRGDVTLYHAWPYIGLLTTNAPVVVLAVAEIDAGMRQRFAAQQMISTQRTQLEASHTRLARAHSLIRRYVPEQVADAVLTDTPEAIDRHERRKLTIFFSDLVGFTDLSEELEPEDLANVLHDYFTEMNAIARRHGGTVDDLVGDAILVFFGAPQRTDDRDQALRAVRMAAEMQAAMGPLNQRWETGGIPERLRVRMGVNTGVVTVGNFGSEERTKYTALGKQVNIAARIQAQCEPGKVLLSHTTWLLVRDDFACAPKGELTLKGLNKPMSAYEVVSSQPS
jgi:class 3 adenylate cyclase